MTDTAGAPAPGTYTLDAGRSTLTFATRHVFGLGAVHGTFAFVTGQVHVDADPTRSSATAVVDAGSFSTGNTTRDTVVRSPKYLNTSEHPRITFVSTGARVADAGYVLRGELTVRDTTGPVELAVEAPEHTSDGIRLRAATRIDRYAFGLTADKGMTARHLVLSLDVLVVPTGR